jgi:serine/threonine protein kinase/photosystem II stability/assembly factor-like uncharacterized protein
MSELIGMELGPYRILEQVGVGGMAGVFKAYHAAMDRYVAVKVLAEHMGWEAELRTRFQQEAKVIARLEHAHILPVYDYGQVGNRLYLVMRYIDAGTLKERMTAGPMEPDEVNRIFHQVGGALAYAHRLGVVHRDIKPSNVLLDAEGDCYLTDFGLAKVMEASVRLTVSGVGMGTPAYMSPEQGQGDPVDARSDIYSLGVVLYEMLTGQVPYQAETPLAVVLKHISAPLPLPSSVRAGLPEAVERVILKAMAKDPDDRFQTVGEMVDALDAAVRTAQAEASTEVAVSVPPAAGSAVPPIERLPEQAAIGVREGTRARWPRIAAWAGGAVILMLISLFALSRLPLVVRPREERQTASPVASPAEVTTATSLPTATAPARPTPTHSPTATATPTPTAVPPTATPTSTHTPTPVPPTSTPTQTPTPSPTPTPIPLVWQRIYSGEIFPRAQVNALAVDPRDPGVLYAATAAGIYKSLDGGSSWRHSGLETARVGALGIDSDDTQTLYAGVFQRGIYKSIDGGLTWQRIRGDTPVSGRDTLVLLVDPHDSRHLYYTFGERIYESQDGGQSWTERRGHSDTYDLVIDPADGDCIYVLGDPSQEGAGIYRSKGRDQPWQKIHEIAVYRLAIAPGDPPILYAHRFVAARQRREVYRSQDGGDSWAPMGGEASTDRSLAVDPRDGQTLYLGRRFGGLEISHDGGRSWGAAGLGGLGVNCFAFALEGQATYVGTTDGVYVTMNKGTTWAPLNSGLGNVFVKVHVDPLDGTTLYVEEISKEASGTAGWESARLYRSSDGGLSWQRLPAPGISSNLLIDPSSGTLYRSTEWAAELYRSVDGGLTWTTLAAPFDAGAAAHAVHPQNGNLYALKQGRSAYLSADGGLSWQERQSPPAGAHFEGLYFDQQGEIAYAVGGTMIGRITSGLDQYVECSRTSSPITHLVIDPTDSQRVFLATDGSGVQASEDGCRSWKPRNVGLDNHNVSAIAMDPTNPDLLYAATNGGAYVSYDGGAQWGAINDGLLGAMVVYDVEIDPNDPSKVYAATPYGIFLLEER